MHTGFRRHGDIKQENLLQSEFVRIIHLVLLYRQCHLLVRLEVNVTFYLIPGQQRFILTGNGKNDMLKENNQLLIYAAAQSHCTRREMK